MDAISPKRIYLDYAATTPIDPLVAKAMSECLTLTGAFGNPSASHSFGVEAHERIETARVHVAQLIGAQPREVIFTSGATEANNLALQGFMRAHRPQGGHLITCTTEHPSVLKTAHYLEKEGYSVTYLAVDSEGRLSLESLSAAFRPDTQLVSLMWVNNELGVIHNISEIAQLCQSKGVALHVDATQAVGKLPIDVHALNIDLLSFSAHKCYGPKGIGALYVRQRPRVLLSPLLIGGGQERGLRSGTLPTHQIVGMGVACQLAQAELSDEPVRVEALKERLWQGLSQLPRVRRLAAKAKTICGILSVYFEGVDSEALMMSLNQLAISRGSACHAATLEPSHVLQAIGLSPALSHNTIRFSLGRFTRPEEIEKTIEAICKEVSQLRAISPLWSTP